MPLSKVPQFHYNRQTVDMRRATDFDTRPVIRQRSIDLQNDMARNNDKSTPFNGQSDCVVVRLLNRSKYIITSPIYNSLQLVQPHSMTIFFY
ncbi:hypothetical protein T05_14943 [Trichinella murrelli]|uniref:Uncharacterized protein n=1 Tax=Trichinella murrelli TaxID=144512 RepID=A0A0V0TWI2_9BILA|nr:hypothetical protein T05_14943 [Trichinella murrelli]